MEVGLCEPEGGPATRTWEHEPREKPAADEGHTEAGHKNSGLAVRGGGRRRVGRRAGRSRGAKSGDGADSSQGTVLISILRQDWPQSRDPANSSQRKGLASVRRQG